MENIINRHKIADGVYFSRITDTRYKKNLISVNFYTTLCEETASTNAIIPCIIGNTNSDYPTNKLMNNKLSRLYSSSVGGSCKGMSDLQCISMSASFLDDSYAIDKENITKEMTDILINCITNPVTENGVFPEKTVEIEKQTVIDDIEAIINDKRSYAIDKAVSILHENEPMAVSPHGTIERAKAITPESAYEAYKNMLRTMHCEIICSGCSDFEYVEKAFTDAFSKIERSDITELENSKSLLKAEVKEVTEKLSVNQSKMVIGFKTDLEDTGALVMMQKIYGGTTSSKLFMNVREKMSLCYYCAARLNDRKGILMVDSGVENANIEKARAEIIHQLDEIRSGNFTEEDINFARMAVLNDYNSISDSAGGLAGWYIARILRDNIITPSQAADEYVNVDKERIIKAANSLKLDTVYVLTSDDKEEE